MKCNHQCRLSRRGRGGGGAVITAEICKKSFRARSIDIAGAQLTYKLLIISFMLIFLHVMAALALSGLQHRRNRLKLPIFRKILYFLKDFHWRAAQSKRKLSLQVSIIIIYEVTSPTPPLLARRRGQNLYFDCAALQCEILKKIEDFPECRRF